MFINKIKCICFVHLFGMVSATVTFSMNSDLDLSMQQSQKRANFDIKETTDIKTIVPNLKLKCDPAVVNQYIENPNTTIITGYIEDDTNDFSLDRSFKEALKVNVDKECIERANGL